MNTKRSRNVTYNFQRKSLSYSATESVAPEAIDTNDGWTCTRIEAKTCFSREYVTFKDSDVEDVLPFVKRMEAQGSKVTCYRGLWID